MGIQLYSSWTLKGNFMGYNITFAGVGSAFTTDKYYQSSFVIEKNNKRLVVDMGGVPDLV